MMIHKLGCISEQAKTGGRSAEYSVMELLVHPLQSVMGGIGLKKRLRSARSLVTLEKFHTECAHLIEGRHFIFIFLYFFLSCDLQ